MGYRYEVKVGGRFYDNKVIFATEAEASHAGYNKLFNWTQCEDYRVVPSDEPVNYRYDADTGAVIHIPTEDLKAQLKPKQPLRRDANGNLIPWDEEHDAFMAFNPEDPDVPTD